VSACTPFQVQARRHTALLYVQVKHVLAHLYCGNSSFVTTCRKCKKESEHSSNVSDFFELDLQVKTCMHHFCCISSVASASDAPLILLRITCAASLYSTVYRM
jgi:hypothetical protein